MRPNDDSRQGCMRRLAHVATISATIVLLAAEAMALSVTLGDQDFANDTVVTTRVEPPREPPPTGAEVTPGEAFAPTTLRIDFVGDNARPTPAYLDVNSLLLSAKHQPNPDIVAMALTASGDGIFNLDGGPDSFAVATVNVGSPGQIAVSADTGAPGPPLTATVCQTRPESGECVTPPAPLVSTVIGSSATPTFGVFAQASSEIGNMAPAGEGNQWHVLGGGPLRGAIPPGLPADIWGRNDSSSITSAWNSGCFDIKRSRMYVLGGGHFDGAYNGVFAYNTITQSWERFTEPSLAYPKHGQPSASVYPDGTPAAVHTYGMVHCLGDELLVASGSKWWTGGGGIYAWFLNLDTRTWRRLDFPPALGYSGAWDPVARRVIVRDQAFSYFAFDPATGAIERPWREDNAGSYDGHTSAFDTARRLVLTIGRGVNGTGGGALLLAVDGREAARLVQFTGATEILRAEAPGLDYDERRQLFVAWMGGPDLFEIDVARRQIVRVAAGGSAPPAQESNGTFNRFRYLGATGNFLLVNRIHDPVYLLVPPASGTPPPGSASGAQTGEMARPGQADCHYVTASGPMGGVGGSRSGADPHHHLRSVDQPRRDAVAATGVENTLGHLEVRWRDIVPGDEPAGPDASQRAHRVLDDVPQGVVAVDEHEIDSAMPRAELEVQRVAGEALDPRFEGRAAERLTDHEQPFVGGVDVVERVDASAIGDVGGQVVRGAPLEGPDLHDSRGLQAPEQRAQDVELEAAHALELGRGIHQTDRGRRRQTVRGQELLEADAVWRHPPLVFGLAGERGRLAPGVVRGAPGRPVHDGDGVPEHVGHGRSERSEPTHANHLHEHDTSASTPFGAGSFRSRHQRPGPCRIPFDDSIGPTPRPGGAPRTA
jgi:hypothetical protein